MNIYHSLENIKLLRERLKKPEKRDAFTQLELIQENAFCEFYELVKPDKTIRIDGIPYSAKEWDRTLAEMKMEKILSLGKGCLVNAETATPHGGFFQVNLTLQRLDILPHCAILYILTMIENVTDGNGEPPFPFMYNFYMASDEKKIFSDLIKEIPLFYPKILIGKIELAEPANKSVADKKAYDVISSQETADEEPDLTELRPLWFAVQRLNPEYYNTTSSGDKNSFVMIFNCGVIYKFQTLAYKDIVAFTDNKKIAKAGGGDQMYMTPEQYAPILHGMPVEKIVINPAKWERMRFFVEKTMIDEWVCSNGMGDIPAKTCPKCRGRFVSKQELCDICDKKKESDTSQISDRKENGTSVVTDIKEIDSSVVLDKPKNINKNLMPILLVTICIL